MKVYLNIFDGNIPKQINLNISETKKNNKKIILQLLQLPPLHQQQQQL
uniref:Uncharacterized protein n=1 Tax=Meloidogyne enterolobii TaxID=390850 RepID=A0A6V7XL21_MELEN|nr:unnamed protein product [Meloidogyne enterolobii]